MICEKEVSISIKSSSLPLDGFVMVVPDSTPPHCVNRQVVSFTPVGIFNKFLFNLQYLFVFSVSQQVPTVGLNTSTLNRWMLATIELFPLSLQHLNKLIYFISIIYLNLIFILKDRCDVPLGIQDGRITRSMFTASSMYNHYYGPWSARLQAQNRGSTRGGWLAKYRNTHQWLQIDLGVISVVKRIATQGRYDANQWVTSYTVSYGNNGVRFFPYKQARRTKVRQLHFFKARTSGLEQKINILFYIL